MHISRSLLCAYIEKCCDMFSHCLISCELTKFGHRSLHLFNQLIKHSCQSLPSKSSMGHPWDIQRPTLMTRLVPLSCSGGPQMGHWNHMNSPTCPTLQWDLIGFWWQTWTVASWEWTRKKNWNSRYTIYLEMVRKIGWQLQERNYCWDGSQLGQTSSTCMAVDKIFSLGVLTFTTQFV